MPLRITLEGRKEQKEMRCEMPTGVGIIKFNPLRVGVLSIGRISFISPPHDLTDGDIVASKGKGGRDEFKRAPVVEKHC